MSAAHRLTMGYNKFREKFARIKASPFMSYEVTILLLFLALLVHKIRLMRPAARGPIVFGIIQHDAAIAALMLLLYAAASLLANYMTDGPRHIAASILRELCMCAFLLVGFLFAIDVAAYHFFITRLYVSDIVTFSSEPRGVFSLLRTAWRVMRERPVLKSAVDVVLLLLLLRSSYALLLGRRAIVKGVRFLVVTAAVLLILWLVPVPGHIYSYVDRPLIENFIERNHNFYVRNTFSDRFRAQVLAAPAPDSNCEAGQGRRINVVLVVVESLSAYHSKFFSGVNDWTPNLDEIAGRETALTNFHANGWTTAGGLVSLLTGTPPLVPEMHMSRTKAFTPIGGTAFTDYLNVPRSLPRRLTELGYRTEFIAPGDLSFLGQDQWLPAIGFQKVISGDDPRFAAQKMRGPFNSVPDRLLFKVALDEVAQIFRDRPYFLVVQTFWSHRPFMDPNDDARLNGEETVFRDTDAQIGAFYKGLSEAGFFRNGLLFITGDHRAMEPFHKSEFDRFGFSAAARIPAVIVTHAVQLPKTIPQDFQQRDFPNSIEALVSNRYCLGPYEGSFLSKPAKPPGCIIQARGDDRDLIYIKCGTEEGTVLAVGDATGFVNGAVNGESSVIQFINSTRARPVN